VSVIVDSYVGVETGVHVASWVGETVSVAGSLVALSTGTCDGWIVKEATKVWVGDGVGAVVAVAGPQAVRKRMSVQVRDIQRCMAKLYRNQETLHIGAPLSFYR
jgi:hypothetical protein